MKDILKALWNGEIAPCESCGVQDPEIGELIGLKVRNREALLKIASGEEKDVFEKYADCTDEYTMRVTEAAFCDGFCLAVRLLTASLA